MPTTGVDSAALSLRPFPWGEVATVLLDMDGTLLDLNFDNVFFRETVPRAYGRRHGLSREESVRRVMAAYREVAGTLAWYDLDHWSRVLEMDIPLLKREVAHLIAVHPGVMAFLEWVRGSGRGLHLVTNAHAASLALKLARTPIGRYFHRVVSSHEVGHAKEDPAFWPELARRLEFHPASTLLVDDSEPVLSAASGYGIRFLVHCAAPSSTQPPNFSERFFSIRGFGELV